MSNVTFKRLKMTANRGAGCIDVFAGSSLLSVECDVIIIHYTDSAGRSGSTTFDLNSNTNAVKRVSDYQLHAWAPPS